MANDFFKLISDLLGGDDNNNENGKVIEKPSNAIDMKENVKNGILGVLNSNFKGQTNDLSTKTLVVHVLDSLVYNSLNNTDFIEYLTLTVSDEVGVSFAGIVVVNENAGEEITYTKVYDKVFIEIKDNKIKPIGKKAVITVINGRGSLVDGESVIDTSVVPNLERYNFNIGRGKHTELSDGTLRENCVAIDDDVNATEYQYNQKVSRSHAYIRYHQENGFYLYVETGGCQLTGNRTRVYRGGNLVKDMNNIRLPFKLEDGDVIELGKSVNLLFKLNE